MAGDKPASPPRTEELESKTVSAPPTGPPPPPPPPPLRGQYLLVDVSLRVLLFASSLVAVVVLATSKQTKMIPYPVNNPVTRVPVDAKFSHSPALIYLLAALSVAGLYSIITTLASLSVILKPARSASFVLVFALMDVLLFGIVASATGAAGGVAYVGLRGNSHVGWSKICNVYDDFCRHLGSSIAVSLLASIVLALLVIVSIFSLHSKLR